jgi:hypothetical protein
MVTSGVLAMVILLVATVLQRRNRRPSDGHLHVGFGNR